MFRVRVASTTTRSVLGAGAAWMGALCLDADFLKRACSPGPRRAGRVVSSRLVAVCVTVAVVVLSSSAAAQAAVTTPLVSTTTSVSAGAAVTDGTTLTVTYNEPPVLASSYSLTLTDGTDIGTLSTTAGSLSAVVTGSSITFTVDGAPSISVGSGLSLAVPLEILESTGVSDGSGDQWDLVASGQVAVDGSGNCSTVGFTRVFGGSNCDIGFGNAGPTAPAVYDVIAVPTQDLPGPPNDAAPEVITSCGVGSSDVAYDVNTEAELGANPCGDNPPGEVSIGNTNSNTLDYIPTPGLASFEQAGVVETIPGSSYVSATAVPPQISGVAVSGDQATFSYSGNVVCQTDSSDPDERSQFSYVTPYTDLNPNDLVYPTAISCPSSGGATSIALTYPGPIPSGSDLRFKYEAYGSGHSIAGAPGSSSVGEREASQSFYTGPGATIDSFTPQSTTLPTSGGGSVDVAMGTTGATAQACTLSAVSLPAAAAPLSLPSVASCGGTATIIVPANTSYATNVVYTVTLTAPGAAGPSATDSITITVPAAPLPAPAVIAPPTISGTAALGQTLTENHGSWNNNPTSYSYQWEDCDGAGSNCSPITGATAQTYVPTTTDDGHTLSVQETASNASGSTTATAAATTTLPTPPSPPAPVQAPTPVPVPVPVPMPAPVDASLPTVSGTPAVGHTLTESHGSWSTAPTSYAYAWERCGLAGKNCAAIPGAIAQTHTLTTADVGHTLRVQETASNASGAGAAATSSPTPPVPTARTSGKHHAPPNTLVLEHKVSSHEHRATFRFTPTGTATRFECALVRKPTRSGEKTPAPEYVSCHSPKTFTRLKAGSYVLYVRAVGPGGADKTPARYKFKIT
jgi:hypothetical protein